MSIHILHLEDDPLDAELVRETLAASGFDVDVHTVESREGFIAELLRQAPDLILSDYSLPSFDGLAALLLAREKYGDVPFIFVSGTIGEDRAVNVLRNGATDYVLKTRLEKLPFSIRRALEAVEGRRRASDAARRIEESERRFRRLIEEIPGFFFTGWIEPGGLRLTFASPQIERMLGYTPVEATADPGFWRSLTPGEDRERMAAALARCGGDGQALEFENRLISREGRAVWVRVALKPEGPGSPEIRGMVTDITQRKLLEEQFLQAQKMEAVGRLAGGVAHDFNNLLTVINGYSELLLADLGPNSPQQADLEEIHNAGKRASALTRQLLAFSRKQVFQPVQIDLNRLIQGLERMLGRLVGEDVTISFEAAPALASVLADPGQIEQVIVNLVVNARDAMPKGGRITIATGMMTLDATLARAHPGLQAGSYARISVTDTGTGIPPEVLGHLFEPFFTTKEKGKGTGLGLATVNGIVMQSGGAVVVESVPGQGTTFRILLPAARGGADAGVEAPRIPQRRGTETVLVAEDQETLLRLITTVLEASGYRVTGSLDGTAALRLAEQHVGPIHLLLTDMVMHAMSGVELAKAFRVLHPGAKVLFMSGYTERGLGDMGPEAAFIQKPFSLDDLRAKVRAVLDAPAGGKS